MSGREDDITAPPPLSQDTPPQPWTPPANFGPEVASRSGITVDVNPASGSGPVAPGYARPPWVDKRYSKRYGHGSPVLGPVLLIAAGVVFLLNNTGVLPWSIWGNLWRLWPLALVAIGLDILFGRRNALVSLVIVLGVLGAGAGVLAYGGGFGETHIISLPLNMPMPEAASADVNIKLNYTNLNLASLPGASKSLASGTLEYYDRQGEPVHTVASEGQKATLRLEERNESNFSMFNFGDRSHKWDVRLNRDVPLTLFLNTGDGNSTLDLTDLHLTDVEFHGGDGNLKISIPQSGAVTGQIDIGEGNIDLVVPPQVAAHVRVEKGDGNVNVDNAFKREGDTTYTSQGSTSTQNKLDLNIKMGDGNVNLRTK